MREAVFSVTARALLFSLQLRVIVVASNSKLELGLTSVAVVTGVTRTTRARFWCEPWPGWKMCVSGTHRRNRGT